MHFRYVFTLLLWCVLVGLDWAEPMVHSNLHVTCSCIFMHTYLWFFIFWYIVVGIFLILSLFLSLFLSCISLLLWHLNANLLRPRILYVLRQLLLLTLHLILFGSMMMKPERTSRRTFVDKAFIWNTTLFCWTFPTLTYPLSFTVGVRSHCVASWSLVLCDHTGSLLQHARNWYFSTSFLLLRLRYAHCSYSRDFLRGTTFS